MVIDTIFGLDVSGDRPVGQAWLPDDWDQCVLSGPSGAAKRLPVGDP